MNSVVRWARSVIVSCFVFLGAGVAYADWGANIQIGVFPTNSTGVEWDVGGLPDLQACLITPSSPTCDLTVKAACNDSLVCTFRGPIPNGPFIMKVFDADTISNEFIGEARCNGADGMPGACNVSGGVAEASTILPSPALADGRYCFTGADPAAMQAALVNVHDNVATLMLYTLASDGSAFLFDAAVNEDGLMFNGTNYRASKDKMLVPLDGNPAAFNRGPCPSSEIEATMELISTLQSIAAAEAKYDAEHDGHMIVGIPLGTKGAASLGNAYREWQSTPAWDTLGWRPDSHLRSVYWVTMPTPTSFLAHGAIDLDGDGDGCATVMTIDQHGELGGGPPIGRCKK